MKIARFFLVLSAATCVTTLATAQNATMVAATNGSAATAASANPPDTNSNSAVVTTFQQRHPRYKLASGDAFDLSFELNPEFNQTVTVQPDGYVTLRSVGDVQVEGQTVAELTETIRTAYGKILNDPMVTVMLKDFQKPYFIADGQVLKPGKYDLRGETTLTEAIAIAGGFTEASKHSQVVLFRKAANGWYEGNVIDVKKMEKKRNLHEDPQLQPGDMLFVPKNRFSKISKFIIPGSSLGAFWPI